MNVPLLTDMGSRLAAHSDSPQLDASVLLGHVIGKPRAWVLAHPEANLTIGEQRRLENALTRLEGGEPLPYVLGHWEFYGLELELTPDVLIPRPETELLVETAIELLKPLPGPVADVGTGSGAIAIALARHLAAVRVLATDISAAALEVARRNAIRHQVSDQIEFAECDLLPGKATGSFHQQGFSLICANLPYIPTATLRGLAVYGHEPELALDGGSDGLDVIRRLLRKAPAWLAPKGRMLLEIEARQGALAREAALTQFPTASVRLIRDLAGHDRVLEIAP